MAGLSYLYDDDDDDNYFHGYSSLLGETALLTAGWGMRKYGNSLQKKGIRGHRSFMERTMLSPGSPGMLPQRIKGTGANYLMNAQRWKRWAKPFTKLGTTSMLLSIGVAGYEAAKGLASAGDSFRTDMNRHKMGSSGRQQEEQFLDSRLAFTQRKRAIQVIHNSQLSARAAFGNESNYLHS